jgi:uncharacterized protein YndB with AHSA1/START domain
MSSAPGSTFIYVTYIRTTPEKLWAALTDPKTIKKYWFGCTCESDFKKGSPWKLILENGSIADSGEILDVDPGKRLVIKWRNEKRPELKAEGFSTCTMELEPVEASVKLTITHTINKENAKFIEAVSGGWPKVLSNLKSLLETGELAMVEPYKACSAA